MLVRAALLLAICARVASAEPTYRAGEDMFRPPIEWSTWIRVAYGALVELEASDSTAARRVIPVATRVTSTWQAAAGIEASLPLSITGDVRLGAWAELGLDNAFAGGELVLTAAPRHLEMFEYDGSGILAIRAGRGTSDLTASIAYGYLAPWKLEGPCAQRFFGIFTGVCEPRPKQATRYMAGVRLVGTITRAIDDPHVWSATLGIEFEPAGALRMFLVRRDWY